jgi:hypothetical protein
MSTFSVGPRSSTVDLIQLSVARTTAQKDCSPQAIRAMADLERLTICWTDRLHVCEHTGTQRFALEACCRCSWLIQMFYSVRSERLLTEEMEYSLLWRWLWAWARIRPCDMSACLRRSRDRLLNGPGSQAVCWAVNLSRNKAPTIAEHFTVNGILVEAWASRKNFKAQAKAAGPLHIHLHAHPKLMDGNMRPVRVI